MNTNLIHKSLTLVIGSILSAIVLKDIPKAAVASSITSTIAVICETVAKKQATRSNPTKSEETPSQPHNIAILWDLQNVNVSKASSAYSPIREIVKLLKDKGQPVIQRVYANWGQVPKSIAKEFSEIGFEQVHISDSKSNCLDWKLTTDFMEILSTHSKNLFEKYFGILT